MIEHNAGQLTALLFISIPNKRPIKIPSRNRCQAKTGPGHPQRSPGPTNKKISVTEGSRPRTRTRTGLTFDAVAEKGLKGQEDWFVPGCL